MMARPHLLLLALLCISFARFAVTFSSRSWRHASSISTSAMPTNSKNRRLSALLMSIPKLGGKIVVSGIGSVDQDEYTLNLLNEQNIWDSVVLTTTDPAAAKKRFLSRTARYTGLLNILDFAAVSNIKDSSELSPILSGVNTWLAFNVSREDVPGLVGAAVAAKVPRMVLTVGLSPDQINGIDFPEFDEALSSFRSAGLSLTLLRHGTIVEGRDDFPYEIVNATAPCTDSVVYGGVLGRVVAEAIRIDRTDNAVYGISTNGIVAEAYLNILRSSGLTRSEEVEKMFGGGLQRAGRIMYDKYESRRKAVEDEEARVKKMKEEAEIERQREQVLLEAELAKSRLEDSNKKPKAPTDIAVDLNIDDEENSEVVYKRTVEDRTQEILQRVWREYNGRMYTKNTSKYFFFEQNKDRARELAIKEFEEEEAALAAKQADDNARNEIMEKYSDENRLQYSKLMALERKEILNQQAVSDIWVKYVFLLLEETLEQCVQKDVLFYNMDEFAQTMLLRKTANELRAMAGLPQYDVIYDSLDASTIVQKLSKEAIGKRVGIDRPIEDVTAVLESKYSSVLKSIPALRGAKQIVELAIETLKREIPTVPMTVAEARRLESANKSKALSASKIDAIKKRGQPVVDGPSTVGRL